jgi:tetratricopeptide (TPR) repeat protein
MNSEGNLRPIPVRWRRYVSGALFPPLVGIVVVACSSERPTDTKSIRTARSTPIPPIPDYGFVVRPGYSSIEFYESELGKATKALQAEANVANYCRRALVYRELGKYDEAIADSNMAIGLDPRNPFGYDQRASIYHKTRQHGLAIADYTKAISLDPESARDWYHGRGEIHKELGRYDTAIADYTKALKLAPDDSEVYYSRGEAYYKKGNLAKAKADLNKCFQRSVHSELITKSRVLLTLVQEKINLRKRAHRAIN